MHRMCMSGEDADGAGRIICNEMKRATYESGNDA